MDEFQDLKTGDRVTVPGWVDGYGIDHSGTITEIELCCDVPLITVMYDKPDCEGRRGNVVRINQIDKKSIKWN